MPTNTIGSVIARENSGLFNVTTAEYAEIIANAANAAAPIAKPLPIAAVVLPSSSSEYLLPLCPYQTSLLFHPHYLQQVHRHR